MKFGIRGRGKLKKVDDVTHCNGCNCMTHTITNETLYHVCGKCGHDKALSDIFQDELKINR